MCSTLKEKIDSALAAFFLEQRASSMARQYPEWFDAVADFVLGGGKRLRPILALLAFKACSDDPVERVLPAGVALELLHNFALIHDDLIDHSESRRNGLSLHARLARLPAPAGDRQEFGRQLALLAGDLLYAHAFAQLTCLDFDASRRQAAVAVVAETAVATGYGACAELLTETVPFHTVSREHLIKEYELKTGAYSFACPLRTGAVLAGAGEADIARLQQYGNILGVAYQIRDDLADLDPAASRLSRPESGLSDILQKKRTLPLWLAYQRGSDDDRRLIDLALNSPEISLHAARQVRSVILANGAVASATEEIEQILAAAQEIRAELTLPPARLTDLDAFLAGLFR